MPDRLDWTLTSQWVIDRLSNWHLRDTDTLTLTRLYGWWQTTDNYYRLINKYDSGGHDFWSTWKPCGPQLSIIHTNRYTCVCSVVGGRGGGQAWILSVQIISMPPTWVRDLRYQARQWCVRDFRSRSRSTVSCNSDVGLNWSIPDNQWRKLNARGSEVCSCCCLFLFSYSLSIKLTHNSILVLVMRAQMRGKDTKPNYLTRYKLKELQIFLNPLHLLPLQPQPNLNSLPIFCINQYANILHISNPTPNPHRLSPPKITPIQAHPAPAAKSVSYTHLTLPTIYSV